MMKRFILILIIGVLFYHAAPASVQSTADFTITITFNGANQTQANNRRDQGVLDYALARGVVVYQADGTTVNQAATATAVRTDIKARLKEDVLRYRSAVATSSATAPLKGQLDAEIP